MVTGLEFERSSLLCLCSWLCCQKSLLSLCLRQPSTPASERERSDSGPLLFVSEDCGNRTDHDSDNAAESIQGPCLGTSAKVPMFSSNGNLVRTTICPPTCSKQQLDDYQEVREVLLDHWFQDLIGTFGSEPSNDEELTQVTKLQRALGVTGIRSPD